MPACSRYSECPFNRYLSFYIGEVIGKILLCLEKEVPCIDLFKFEFSTIEQEVNKLTQIVGDEHIKFIYDSGFNRILPRDNNALEMHSPCQNGIRKASFDGFDGTIKRKLSDKHILFEFFGRNMPGSREDSNGDGHIVE